MGKKNSLQMQKRRKHRMSIGKGHGGMQSVPEPIKQKLTNNGFTLAKLRGMLQPNCEYYKMGQCNIFISAPYPEQDEWHMSIACDHRYPTWDEIAKARYSLIPNDVTMAMVLPPQEEYINIHSYTFQLHEVARHE